MLLNYACLFSFFLFLSISTQTNSVARLYASPQMQKCDCNQNKTISIRTKYAHILIASNGGGMGSISTTTSSSSSQQSFANKSPVGGDPPSNLTASSDSNLKSQTKEFNFQTVHEAFGREIEQDLRERRRLKELAQKPLIQF